ncbi:probable ATP-dependent RNA helicase DDX4 [Neoarius graeffei]|uniref:probable ATP-dependent RNA helicase DDX4 n=1 Tax=Neoarius graeffei TaxID=443677 RepID=UPI00298C0F53|nr:probable ATP-dependent RNA helicase DDX4 [Neoarius graeffei]
MRSTSFKSQYLKKQHLLDLLKTTGTQRTMVFVETKRSADFIATFLFQEKVPTTSIHGDREQGEREKALSDFRTGQCPVLVATSVTARGLDIEHVQHVVNFDLPKTIDEYVHHIGRTGRCGNTGKAMSFFDPEPDTPLAYSLVKVLSGAQQEVPSWLEEIAFNAHGTTGFNPRWNVFASSDTRRDFLIWGNNTLDQVYTTLRGAYKALFLPHIGASDHITLMRMPAYRPLVKVIKPVRKQVRVWLEGSSEALQDCFNTTDWNVFKKAATYHNITDLQEYTDTVSAYITKCIDDVTDLKTITVQAN